ncbi:MAG: FGGY-family carbohydrate kinase [Acidobacteriaceae bacterium]
MKQEPLTASAREVPPAPTDQRALVAIDLGAESCRVSLLRWQSNAPRIQLVHRFPNQATERPGGLHWDINHIMNELERGLRDCAPLAPEGIRSLAIDGWAVDYVRIDAGSNPIADPFCYRDERTIASEQTLHLRISPEAMRELTGIQLLRINTAYQFFADSPEIRTLRWLNLPEYILHRLGGRAVSERTNASHTQMLDLEGQWSPQIFAALNAPIEQAPTLVNPGADIGALNGPLAELPPFSNTRLIAPACHDTASAIASIPDIGDDWAYISSGTWSLVGTVLSSPINTPQARQENFTNLRGVDGTFCFHKNVNGMWLLRQCMEAWNENSAQESREPLTVADLVMSAASVPSLDYTFDVDDPDLLLPGHMPHRINEQLRRRNLPPLNPSASHAPQMASFLFHSLAARYAEVLRSVADITGKRLKRLYIMGGGSQNELLNRLTATATGLELVRAGTECSTAGNFAVQLATLEPSAGHKDRPTSAWAALLQPRERAQAASV